MRVRRKPYARPELAACPFNINEPEMLKGRWKRGLLLCSIYLGDLFAIRGMSIKCIMLFVVFAIVTEPMMRYGTMIIEKIGKRITRRIEKRKKEKML